MNSYEKNSFVAYRSYGLGFALVRVLRFDGPPRAQSCVPSKFQFVFLDVRVRGKNRGFARHDTRVFYPLSLFDWKDDAFYSTGVFRI